MGRVHKFYTSEVDKKCAGVRARVPYSLSASLSVGTLVTSAGAGSRRAEVCDSAAVMNGAWPESDAKWTAFSPEISHHMSFSETIQNFATTWWH